ncbi:5-(carboxyamino)imidazole ribonucleotide mutase [Blattabacterium cuenoti]|uniref:5-(carboxyamino)imidazole ribonucleotide mutase n=1 Tax=Blattabacterium cuenoti TaxID=1653831 RepID=UPI00163C52CF|nr:5-(carboxyamino)imidazole ribonucleotide mutase [Blattabacterium cuenoti]
MKISIFLGSVSDQSIINPAIELIKKFNINYSCYVISAHRLPDRLITQLKETSSDGTEVIIAVAGLSAHLPGIISSRTILPVIGVPVCSTNGLLGGMDALLSMIQMPKEVPVSTVGINNSYNAALLAIRILSIKYRCIKNLLITFQMHKKQKLINEININL